jgi:hypothetical protein
MGWKGGRGEPSFFLSFPRFFRALPGGWGGGQQQQQQQQQQKQQQQQQQQQQRVVHVDDVAM